MARRPTGPWGRLSEAVRRIQRLDDHELECVRARVDTPRWIARARPLDSKHARPRGRAADCGDGEG